MCQHDGGLGNDVGRIRNQSIQYAHISVIYVYGSCAETMMTATIACNIILCCHYYYRFVSSCVQISRYELFRISAYCDKIIRAHGVSSSRRVFRRKTILILYIMVQPLLLQQLCIIIYNILRHRRRRFVIIIIIGGVVRPRPKGLARFHNNNFNSNDDAVRVSSRNHIDLKKGKKITSLFSFTDDRPR